MKWGRVQQSNRKVTGGKCYKAVHQQKKKQKTPDLPGREQAKWGGTQILPKGTKENCCKQPRVGKGTSELKKKKKKSSRRGEGELFGLGQKTAKR